MAKYTGYRRLRRSTRNVIRITEPNNEDEWTEIVEEKYTPDQQGSLTDAILDAIAELKGVDITTSDFILVEDVDPDALDNLFHHDAEPRTTVTFNTDDVRIGLYGDGAS